METSDSECFESADESFHSDDESVIANRVRNINLKDVENEDKKEFIKNKQDVSVPHTENVVDSAKNIEVEKNKLSKSKLGTKLGTKVTKTSETKNEQALLPKETDPEETIVHEEVLEENLWENDDGWGDIEDNLDITDLETIQNEIKPLKIPTFPQINLADTLTDKGEVKHGTICSKYNPDEDRWEFDSWEPVDSEEEEQFGSSEDDDKPVTDKKVSSNDSSWGSWGNWGVSSILSTATQGVTTLTSHVSHGLTTVLESGMGVPDPEELARINAVEQKQLSEKYKEEQNVEDDEKAAPTSGTPFSLGNLVSGVSQITKIVETTGNKVILSGLDTLETIGKKTMEVLQEGDPGLKKKRAFLKIDQDRPVLSQLLREAKEKAERENKELQQKHLVKKPNYESIFDDYQGLVHLEALEMLSKQCDIKLQTILETHSGDALKDLQETLEQVKELCEIPDEDEEETVSLDEIKNKLETAVSEINVPISYSKLISSWEETDEWLTNLNLNVCSEAELHKQAIETLAQLTALAVEQFHKMGELLLIKEYRSTADEADSLVQLTTSLTTLIGIVAGKFSDKLNVFSKNPDTKDEVNSLITNIFFEAANSSSYIQDAFHLLIPVLQVGTV